MSNDDRQSLQMPDRQLQSLLRRLARQSRKQPVRPEWKNHLIRSLNRMSFLASHVFIVVVLILAIAVIHAVLHVFGYPTLFDWFPARYIFDLMDLALIVAVIVAGTLEAFDVFRK
jgi:hypothetical protein